MKNREYRVLVTLALMASLVVGNIAGTSVNVQAADNKDKSRSPKMPPVEILSYKFSNH